MNDRMLIIVCILAGFCIGLASVEYIAHLILSVTYG